MAVVGGVLRQTGDDALYMQADEVVDDAHLGLALFVGVGTDNGIATLGSLLLDAVEHRGIVVTHQIGNDNANHPRGFLTQTLGKRIGTVVQLLSQRLHPLLHLLTYLWRAAQRSADGCNTYAKFLGKVLQ